ncbi:uncharacterized protein LOC106067491 isoform X1 [Biomphalaria glabrata]|uniref:Uncharacterized protein LOC106067491 isoform X1 n=1 Tax=Biomphalaria glabrata TaxID=6526 RepID=A0A9W3BDN9_BIOGL|nr:uncharacterized protein LOC106067491 isoform X1 [Biomphalaria glabrata]
MLTTLTIFLVITPACMTQTTDLPLVNPLEPLKCYLCGENNGPSFPDCLSTNISCHKNEVCSIRYTAIESETSIKCQNKTVCDIEICHANARCVPGGYQIYPGQCEVCCNTTECVDRVVRNVKPTQPPNHTIRCMSCNGSECNNSLNLTVCNTGYCSQNVVYSGTTVLQTVKGCSTRQHCEETWTKQEEITRLECLLALNPPPYYIPQVSTPISCFFCCDSDLCNAPSLTTPLQFHV